MKAGEGYWSKKVKWHSKCVSNPKTERISRNAPKIKSTYPFSQEAISSALVLPKETILFKC